MYCICRPCKNNRCDLCLKEPISREAPVSVQLAAGTRNTFAGRFRRGSYAFDKAATTVPEFDALCIQSKPCLSRRYELGRIQFAVESLGDQ
jgi:hypothetical protein